MQYFYPNMTIKKFKLLFTPFALLVLVSCTEQNESKAQYADVLEVEVSGTENNFTFSVTIRSPDTGCEQFADWWEVITPDGQLIYRRILLHSHVNEQPFSRSGGPVNIDTQKKVIVRAHMNKTGYGGLAMQGTVKDEFLKMELASDFAVSLEKTKPLPTGCAF